MQEVLDTRADHRQRAVFSGRRIRILTGSISAAAGRHRLRDDRRTPDRRRFCAKSVARWRKSTAACPAASAVVVAMGKLGGREMTAASDVDLILIYDFDREAAQSDGPKPLAPQHYYTRLTQRLINAISARTAEGALYDVDMRLRPSGQKGPVATQLSSFTSYQANEAWTWEHMALTRARVIAGSRDLGAARRGRDPRRPDRPPRPRRKSAADIRDMRERIEAEKATTDIWDLKQVRGGLVDLEFIAQHLQLVFAHGSPVPFSIRRHLRHCLRLSPKA